MGTAWGPRGLHALAGIVPFCDSLKDSARGRSAQGASPPQGRPAGNVGRGQTRGLWPVQWWPCVPVPDPGARDGWAVGVFLLSRPRSSGPSRPVSPKKGQSLGLPCQAALSAGWGRTLLSAACPVPRVLVPRPLISLSDSCSLAPLNPHCLWPKAGAPNVRRLVSLQGRRDRARKARLSSPVQWGRWPPAVTSASVQRSAQGAAAWQHMRVRSLTSVPGTNAKLRG